MQLEQISYEPPEVAIIDKSETGTICLSIGIIAWNEEKAIGAALQSLFEQSLFERLDRRNFRCEILCLANGCTDRTVAIAEGAFQELSRKHRFRRTFSCRAVDIQTRGKLNAWNQFVHHLAAREARFLFLMDADILFHGKDTLWNMLATLEANPAAWISTDQPCKSVSFKRGKSVSESLSLLASKFTRAGDAQLCGQLYCIRSDVARKIYLPKDLAACEDGFIKSLVCTDFLTRPTNPARIQLANEAFHIFEPYTSVRAILKNQKRQIIGQTMVHLLVDDYLRTLAPSERMNLAAFIQEKERTDPLWLKRLIANHLKETKYFWRLVPGIAGYRFKRLARIKGFQKLPCLPIAVAGFLVSMISCFSARSFLKQGQVNYWPHAKSSNVG